jgi:hypothetical protein
MSDALVRTRIILFIGLHFVFIGTLVARIGNRCRYISSREGIAVPFPLCDMNQLMLKQAALALEPTEDEMSLREFLGVSVDYQTRRALS